MRVETFHKRFFTIALAITLAIVPLSGALADGDSDTGEEAGVSDRISITFVEKTGTDLLDENDQAIGRLSENKGVLQYTSNINGTTDAAVEAYVSLPEDFGANWLRTVEIDGKASYLLRIGLVLVNYPDIPDVEGWVDVDTVEKGLQVQLWLSVAASKNAALSAEEPSPTDQDTIQILDEVTEPIEQTPDATEPAETGEQEEGTFLTFLSTASWALAGVALALIAAALFLILASVRRREEDEQTRSEAYESNLKEIAKQASTAQLAEIKNEISGLACKLENAVRLEHTQIREVAAQPVSQTEPKPEPPPAPHWEALVQCANKAAYIQRLESWREVFRNHGMEPQSIQPMSGIEGHYELVNLEMGRKFAAFRATEGTAKELYLIPSSENTRIENNEFFSVARGSVEGIADYQIVRPAIFVSDNGIQFTLSRKGEIAVREN